MKQVDPSSVAGLILAGGAHRPGGIERGLSDWQGKPLAAWVLAALQVHLKDVMISASRSLEAYRRITPEVVPDRDDLAGSGPLAGLLAGMLHARALGYESVMVCPCDTPRVTPELFSHLMVAAGPFPTRPALAAVRERLHPLHGLYPVYLTDQLENWLLSGGRQVRGFADSVAAMHVDCTDERACFSHYDSRDDVESVPAD